MVLSYANRCQSIDGGFPWISWIYISTYLFELNLVLAFTRYPYSVIHGMVDKKILAPEHHTAKHCCGGRAPRLLTSLGRHELKPARFTGPIERFLFCFHSRRWNPETLPLNGPLEKNLPILAWATAVRQARNARAAVRMSTLEFTEWKHHRFIFYASSLIPQICPCLHSLQLISGWYLAKKSTT